jgi:hypothetical protein
LYVHVLLPTPVPADDGRPAPLLLLLLLLLLLPPVIM